MRSRSSNLPETRYRSSLETPPGLTAFSTSSKTKGWLQILRSCIIVLFNPLIPVLLITRTKNRIANASVDIHTTYPFSPDAVYRIPLFFIWEYNLTWRAESLHFTTRSTLSGNSASTSFFRRRSRNGRRTLWRRLIIKSCSSSFSATLSWTPWLLKGVLNHSSKLFTLLKIFGKIKFSNAHSSGKLFYS